MNAKKLAVALGLAFAFLAMQMPNFAATGEASSGVHRTSYDGPSAKNQPMPAFDTAMRAPLPRKFVSNGLLGPFYRI